jgi:hypothetical protein
MTQRPWTDNERAIVVKWGVALGVVDQSCQGSFEGKLQGRTAQECYTEWLELQR